MCVFQKKFFHSITLILFFISGEQCVSQVSAFCNSNRFTDIATFDSSDIRIDTNRVYAISKNYFSGVNDTLRMNLFYPDTLLDTMKARPFILLIHGGSFAAGGLHDMDYQCMEYARRGYVTATISYRLGWTCNANDFLNICLQCGSLYTNIQTATYEAAQDGRAAMRFIDDHALEYKIDTGNYFIGGTSAGSITALHVAFWDQMEADAFCPWATGQVGLLDTAGNSLSNTWQIKGVIDHCGAVSKDSVILNNGNISLISFHDEGDCVVPNQYGQVISCFCQAFYWVAGSSVLDGILAANSVCTNMNLVPLSINHCSFPEYELVNRASCFIRSVLCSTCQSAFNNTPYVPQRCNSGIGMEEINSLQSIQLFPNPVSDEFYLKGLSMGKKYTVELFDFSGRKAGDQIIFGASEYPIRLNNLPDGMYSLRILSGESTRSFKLILTR